MGLFDKKQCSRCGKDLGLIFGKTKIADGTICKDCNAMLSPYLTGKSKLTLAQIEEHLKYRQQNKADLLGFKATTTYDGKEKVFFDDNQKKFIVYTGSNYYEKNIDIISVDQISSCQLKVDEDQEELFKTDSEGNEVSYDPAKYETSYSYTIELALTHKWINSLTIEVSDGYISEDDKDELLRVDNLANEIVAKLTNTTYTAKTSITTACDSDHWSCPSCGQVNENTSKFCTNCGSQKSSGAKFCGECGTKLPDGTKFCPNCGKAVN